jgi:hypothetical protein
MTATALPVPPARDLRQLDEVSLDPPHQRLMDSAAGHAGGPPSWRQRKLSELRLVLALAQVSRRFGVEWADARADLRLMILMLAPVPCLPDPTAPLCVAPAARLGLVYREEAVRLPQPGYSFIQLLEPRHAWHPNIATGPQHLCLGPKVAAGTRAKSLLLTAYGALTLQSVQFDIADAAGVLNPDAAVWWQANTDKIPLTREPFLRPE